MQGSYCFWAIGCILFWSLLPLFLVHPCRWVRRVTDRRGTICIDRSRSYRVWMVVCLRQAYYLIIKYSLSPIAPTPDSQYCERVGWGTRRDRIDSMLVSSRETPLLLPSSFWDEEAWCVLQWGRTYYLIIFSTFSHCALAILSPFGHPTELLLESSLVQYRLGGSLPFGE